MLSRSFFIFILVGFTLPLLVGAQSSQEEIIDWQSRLEIKADSRLIVSEKIVYDFGKSRRHGIYRDIPVKYQTGHGRRSIDLTVLGVKRDDEFENFLVKRQGNNIRIRIGREDFTISGRHTYLIIYEVRRGLNYFDNYDELYWNVTGNGWSVPIKRARSEIVLPAKQEESNLQLACYQGGFGSQDRCVIKQKQGGVILAEARGMLRAGEGMTVAIGFPKGLVMEPSWFERLEWVVKDNLVLLLPIVVLLVMFYLWYRYGRDPRGRGTIIPEYEPPVGLTPILVGSLVDERVDNRDLTAGIIYLAEQGFLTIKREEEGKWFKHVDYILRLKKDLSQVPEIPERHLLVAVFGESGRAGEEKKISKLRKSTSSATKIKLLRKAVNKEMVKRGFFASSPIRIRNNFIVLGIFVDFISFIFVSYDMALTIAGFISGVIIVGFGIFMPRKTKYGVKLKEKILGFKEFLSVTDKERFKFHNSPQKSPEQFMKYLPYAIALGVEKEWAQQFAEMYMDPPQWYQGDFARVFVAQQLVEELQGFSSKFSGVVTAASGGSGSSGGGFSGGGFGGGGGGSW